jgi:hypothetical protein
VYRIAVPVATAIEAIDIEMRYMWQRGHNSKWQCHLAHIPQFVLLFSVWSERKLIEHFRDL